MCGSSRIQRIQSEDLEAENIIIPESAKSKIKILKNPPNKVHPFQGDPQATGYHLRQMLASGSCLWSLHSTRGVWSCWHGPGRTTWGAICRPPGSSARYTGARTLLSLQILALMVCGSTGPRLEKEKPLHWRTKLPRSVISQFTHLKSS